MTEPDPDIETLVQTHYAGVWRFLRLLGCEHVEADDLTQDTFLAVLHRPVEFRNHAAFAAYLRRIARHTLIDLRRRQQRLFDIRQALVVERVFEHVAADGGRDWQDALAHCLETLTERTQTALEMAYGGGMATDELADALEMKPNGAKTLLQRARARLKDCIERRLRL